MTTLCAQSNERSEAYASTRCKTLQKVRTFTGETYEGCPRKS